MLSLEKSTEHVSLRRFQNWMRNREKISTAIGWTSLLSGLLLSGLFVSGVVANAVRNEGLGNVLLFLAIFVAVAWFPLSVLAIAVAPKSTVARLGCLLPFFVWGLIWLMLIYVFKQM